MKGDGTVVVEGTAEAAGGAKPMGPDTVGTTGAPPCPPNAVTNPDPGSEPGTQPEHDPESHPLDNTDRLADPEFNRYNLDRGQGRDQVSNHHDDVNASSEESSNLEETRTRNVVDSLSDPDSIRRSRRVRGIAPLTS